jgi:hypothetical protein
VAGETHAVRRTGDLLVRRVENLDLPVDSREVRSAWARVDRWGEIPGRQAGTRCVDRWGGNLDLSAAAHVVRWGVAGGRNLVDLVDRWVGW